MGNQAPAGGSHVDTETHVGGSKTPPAVSGAIERRPRPLSVPSPTPKRKPTSVDDGAHTVGSHSPKVGSLPRGSGGDDKLPIPASSGRNRKLSSGGNSPARPSHSHNSPQRSPGHSTPPHAGHSPAAPAPDGVGGRVLCQLRRADAVKRGWIRVDHAHNVHGNSKEPDEIELLLLENGTELVDGAKVAILSRAYQRYFSCVVTEHLEGDGGVQQVHCVDCHASACGADEVFVYAQLEGGRFALRASNGKFLVPKQNVLCLADDSSDPAVRFVLDDLSKRASAYASIMSASMDNLLQLGRGQEVHLHIVRADCSTLGRGLRVDKQLNVNSDNPEPSVFALEVVDKHSGDGGLVDGCKIALRSVKHNRYLSCTTLFDIDIGALSDTLIHFIDCSAKQVGPHETFTFRDLREGRCALKASNGKYVWLQPRFGKAWPSGAPRSDKWGQPQQQQTEPRALCLGDVSKDTGTHIVLVRVKVNQ